MAGNTAGSIIIDIVAKTGELQTDVDRAQSSIHKLQRELQKFQKETALAGKEFERNFVGPMREGEKAIGNFNNAAKRGADGVSNLGKGMQQNQGAFRNANQVIQNTSYQITDFVVQVQGGVSAMRAFSQQAPQFLGAFGPTGAMLGVVAALSGAFIPLAVEAIKGASAVKTLDEAQKSLADAMSQVNVTAQTFDMKNMIEQFNAADANVRRAIISLIEYRKTAAEIALQETNRALEQQLKGLIDPGLLQRAFGNFENVDLGLKDTRIAKDFFAEIRSGTTEAQILAQKYGSELMKGNSEAQKLAATLNKVALDTQSAANAASAQSKFLQQARAAGAQGMIPVETGKQAKADNTLQKMFENQRVGADKFIESMQRSNEQVQFQTSLLGRNAQEVEVLNAQYKIQAELQKTIQDIERQNGTIRAEELEKIKAAAEAAIAIQTAAITSRQQMERSASYGMEQSMRSYVDNAGNMAKNLEGAFTSAFKGMEDGIVQFAMTGKMNFADFANSVISDIMRIYVRMMIAGLVGKALGAFAMPNAGGQHSVQGNSDYIYDLWKGGFAGYAGGGYTGEGNKYDIAGPVHKGEFVFNKEATKRIGVGNLYKMMRGYADGGLVGSAPMSGGIGAGNVNINIKNEAGGDGYQATATARKNESGLDIDILVRKAVNSDLMRNGPITQQMSNTFNLRRTA